VEIILKSHSGSKNVGKNKLERIKRPDKEKCISSIHRDILVLVRINGDGIITRITLHISCWFRPILTLNYPF